MKVQQRGLTVLHIIIGVAIVAVIGVVANFYSYVFSTTVTGELQSVQSAVPSGSIVTPGNSSATFSGAVAIAQADGNIVTFSTEDRQWAVYRDDKAKGICATAKVFPYPPWNLEKSGTYFGGRLISSKKCATPATQQ